MNYKEQNQKKNYKKIRLIITLIIAIALPLAIIFFMNSKKDVQEERTSSFQDPFKKDGELIFISKDSKQLKKINVEIADDEQKRQLGLMFRPFMSEDNGMLFIFPAEQPLSFWMKNTMISLDMFFINSNFEIVTIHKSTTPYSEQSYTATEKGRYVVETVAGFTDKYNIKVGDKIYYTILK